MSQQQPIYPSPEHQPYHHLHHHLHTAYPQPPTTYARPPPQQQQQGYFSTVETPSPPTAYVPHNPIAAAAAAAAAANANFARLQQHRPFHEVKRRRRLSPDETRRLTYIFTQVTTKPDSSMRQKLAEELNMTARAVQVWFQNRRAKVKREQEAAMVNGHLMPPTDAAAVDESATTSPTSPRPNHFHMEGEYSHASTPSNHEAPVTTFKEEELQVIQSMLNYDIMDDEAMFNASSSREDSASDKDSALELVDMIKDNKNALSLTICTGLKEGMLSDTTLTAASLMHEQGMDELTSPTFSDPYEEALFYNLHPQPSSPQPSIAAMADFVTNAFHDLVIPFPGTPFTPTHHPHHITASPHSLPLTPAQELEVLDLLQLPTAVQPATPIGARKVRPIAPRCNSNSTCYPPSPANLALRIPKDRKSRSQATSPYPMLVSPEVRQLQREQSARRYSWSVGEH